MVGRNFWAQPQGSVWIVREEGLPGEASFHACEEEAWAAANERAGELKGEAFLADEDGTVRERRWHGSLPRDMTF
jgi:hypothetical protein